MLPYSSLIDFFGKSGVQILIFLEISNTLVVGKDGHDGSLEVEIIVNIRLVDEVQTRGFAQFLDVGNCRNIIDGSSIFSVIDDDIFEST